MDRPVSSQWMDLVEPDMEATVLNRYAGRAVSAVGPMEITLGPVVVRVGTDVDAERCGECSRWYRAWHDHGSARVRIVLAARPVDFRKGMDGPGFPLTFLSGRRGRLERGATLDAALGAGVEPPAGPPSSAAEMDMIARARAGIACLLPAAAHRIARSEDASGRRDLIRRTKKRVEQLQKARQGRAPQLRPTSPGVTCVVCRDLGRIGLLRGSPRPGM
jgi:hypothetical protein